MTNITPNTSPAGGHLRDIVLRRYQQKRMMAEHFVSVELLCPACRSAFNTLQLRTMSIRPVRGEDYDEFLLSEFNGPNPNHYAVTVCPDCLFAAYTEDVTDLGCMAKAPIQADAPARQQSEEWKRHTYTGLRDHAAAQASLELALHCYGFRKRNRHALQGALHMQMAWLAHETGHPDAERVYVHLAYQDFNQAYSEETATTAKDEVRQTYILGLLAQQLDLPAEALRWFQETIKHPDIEKLPEWERRARARWLEIRQRGTNG
jgi:uncharacterized protein (DUF2225 family)